MAIVSDLGRLADLQELDTSLDHMAYRRAHLPERIEHGQCAAATAAAKSTLASNQTRRSALEAEYASLESRGRELDAKVARLEGQMRNVVVTREAEAFQREIAQLRSERETDDERGIELLDESERLATEAELIQAQIDAALASEAAVAARLAVADAALDTEAADLRDRRAAAAAAIPVPLLEEYQRRRPAFDGVAVARLQGSRCTGCHLDLSRAEVEAVRAVPDDALPECPQCARILVR